MMAVFWRLQLECSIESLKLRTYFLVTVNIISYSEWCIQVVSESPTTYLSAALNPCRDWMAFRKKSGQTCFSTLLALRTSAALLFSPGHHTQQKRDGRRFKKPSRPSRLKTLGVLAEARKWTRSSWLNEYILHHTPSENEQETFVVEKSSEH